MRKKINRCYECKEPLKNIQTNQWMCNKVQLNVKSLQKFSLYTKKKNERMGYYTLLYWVALCSLVYWFYREIKL